MIENIGWGTDFMFTVFCSQHQSFIRLLTFTMDYAALKHFESLKAKGWGTSLRGFETVTFAYQGEVEHRDSAGGGGIC